MMAGKSWTDVAVDIGKKVTEVGAPLLGLALGGPAGAAIGQIVAAAIGADPNDPEDLLLKIQNPEAAVKIKEIEATHDVEITRIALQNVEGARARNIAVTQATGKLEWPLYAMAFVVVLGFFVLVALLMYKVIPAGNGEAIFILFGAESAAFGAIVNYLFGSSKGSNDKTALLAGGKS